MRTFVIAEVACCHDGDLNKAYRLIRLAKEIGCDAVKFQWCSNPEKLAARRGAQAYLEGYRLLNFPTWWFKELTEYAQAQGIEWMTSVYLPEDIPTVLPWTKRLKIASFEAEAPDMIRVLSALKGVKVIISLGMAGKEQLWPGVDVAYLHCVSAYPTPPEQINLSQIRAWPRTGLSDHTKHPITGALAVAAGAGIIEFHLRLWETFPTNADFLVSRNPAEAEEYVRLIRLAETMLWGKPGVQEAEQDMLRYRVRG